MLNRYSQCRLETLRNLNNFQTIGKTLCPGTSVPSKGQWQKLTLHKTHSWSNHTLLNFETAEKADLANLKWKVNQTALYEKTLLSFIDLLEVKFLFPSY